MRRNLYVVVFSCTNSSHIYQINRAVRNYLKQLTREDLQVETRYAIGRSYYENGIRRMFHGVMFSFESFKKVRKLIRRVVDLGNDAVEMNGMNSIFPLSTPQLVGSSMKEIEESTQDEDVEMDSNLHSMPNLLWGSRKEGNETEPGLSEHGKVTSTVPLIEWNDVDSSIDASVDPVSRLKGIFFPSFPPIYFRPSE
jgi:hypothetical protein